MEILPYEKVMDKPDHLGVAEVLFDPLKILVFIKKNKRG